MKTYFILFLFLLCSCRSSDETAEITLPQLTTKEVTVDEDGLIILGGQVNNNGGESITKNGVVWGTSANVSLENYTDKEEQFSSNDNFEFKSKKVFLPNTVYYFRAFAQNSKGLAYGNTTNYKTGSVVETLDPLNITTVEATLVAKFQQPQGNLSYAGFVYATTPNPTIYDKSTPTTGVIGSMNYTIKLSNLIRNTEYYIRSFTKINEKYYYGEQKKIKTAGYFGPAGGIVAYDKGIVSDGWRYLEISIKDVGRNYADTGFYRFGAIWSKSPNSYLAGTSEKMGDGMNNTNFIVSKIPGESAAKFCANHTANGYSDWFLPSKEEATTILNSLYKGGMSLTSGLQTWSSSEIDAESAYFVYATGDGAVSAPKFGDSKTYPVRKY